MAWVNPLSQIFCLNIMLVLYYSSIWLRRTDAVLYLGINCSLFKLQHTLLTKHLTLQTHALSCFCLISITQWLKKKPPSLALRLCVFILQTTECVKTSKYTYCLVFHACEDDVEHLCERSLGCGLVDEVLAGQVDVVAGTDSLQNSALVDLYVLRGHRCQQSLDKIKILMTPCHI